MESTAIVVPATMLIRLSLIALYLPVVCLGVSLLFPRLSSGAKVLLTCLLIGQISLILLNLEAKPDSSPEKWLWWEDGEWNVFAAFSSLQMALVGVLAMATSGRDPERIAWRRLYFGALGLVFLFIALDDFTGVFKSAFDRPSEPWKQGYRLLGAATAGLTILMALRARQGARIWYLCLLLGLSLIGTGGLAIDNLSRYCGMLGIIRLDGCLTYETLEEGMEMLGTWLSLLAVLGLFSGSVNRPPFLLRRVPISIVALLAGLLFSYSLQLPQEVRRLALQYELANHSQTASVGYESSLSLLGFRTDRHKGTFAVGLYLSSASDNIAGGQLGFSIHLVDQVTGDSVAGLDTRAGGKRWIWIFDTENSSTFRQWMEIEQVPRASVNRALWIVLTVWREDDGEFIRQRVLASDLQLLDETQVVLGELVREAKCLRHRSYHWRAMTMASRWQPWNYRNAPRRATC